MRVLGKLTASGGRRAGALLAVAGTMLLVVGLQLGSAQAIQGSAGDPNDSSGTFDISNSNHNDGGDLATGKVVYKLTSFDDINRCYYRVRWLIDFDGDGQIDAVVAVSSNNQGGVATWDVHEVQDENGNKLQDVTLIEYDQATKTLTVELNKTAFLDAGMPANASGYNYRLDVQSLAGAAGVVTEHCLEGTDLAPNAVGTFITHAFVVGGGPGGTTATTQGGGGTGTTATTGGFQTVTTTSTTTTVAGQTTFRSTAISASPSTVSPGGSTTIAGSGFPGNTDVTISMASDPVVLSVVRTDSNGNFAVTVLIPRSTTPGLHTITASGGGRVATFTISVGGLAVTGSSNNFPMVGVGAALLFAGMVLLAGRLLAQQNDDYIANL